MDSIQKEALRMSRVYLVENVQTNLIWDYLVQYEVFTPMMLEYITCKKPRSEQVRTLLQDLDRRHYGAYEAFIKCLNDTKQEHCALEIRRNYRIAEGKQGTTAVTESSGHEQMSYKENLMRSLDIQYGASAFGSREAGLHRTTPSGSVVSHPGMSEIVSVGVQEDEDVEMTPVTQESSSVLESPPDTSRYSRARQENPDGVYKMESDPRGLMYIINNQQFVGLENRDGSDQDEAMLQQLFRQIGFHVEVDRDLTAQQMKDKLLALRYRQDLKKVDSLIVVILSHGRNKEILGIDGGSITDDDLMEWFGNHNCPFLMGKPKLFILQACRGERVDPGVPTSCSDSSLLSTSVTGSSFYSPSSSMSSCTTDVSLVPDEEPYTGSDGGTQGQSLPRNTDILIAHSSVYGYVAYRWTGQSKGSIFITEVVRVFQEYAHVKHVNEMFTQVNRHVAAFNTPQEGCHQMSSSVNQLLKDWYLNPKKP